MNQRHKLAQDYLEEGVKMIQEVQEKTGVPVANPVTTAHMLGLHAHLMDIYDMLDSRLNDIDNALLRLEER